MESVPRSVPRAGPWALRAGRSTQKKPGWSCRWHGRASWGEYTVLQSKTALLPRPTSRAVRPVGDGSCLCGDRRLPPHEHYACRQRAHCRHCRPHSNAGNGPGAEAATAAAVATAAAAVGAAVGAVAVANGGISCGWGGELRVQEQPGRGGVPADNHAWRGSAEQRRPDLAGGGLRVELQVSASKRRGGQAGGHAGESRAVSGVWRCGRAQPWVAPKDKGAGAGKVWVRCDPAEGLTGLQPPLPAQPRHGP